MKCNHPTWSPVCSFHYNGECLREHNYECSALITNEKAIDILSEELDHTEFHLKNDKGKAPAYYQELGDYCDALKLAIDALKNRRNENDLRLRS